MSQHKRIFFAGDPHGNFKPLISAVHKHKPEAVVLLGDYDLDEPLEKCLETIADLTEIWWIAGNHFDAMQNKKGWSILKGDKETSEFKYENI